MTRPEKPKLIFGQPAEFMLRRACEMYLRKPMRGFAPLKPNPQFVVELMKWFVECVPERKLTGPEIAVMVDHFAASYTTQDAIEHVYNILLPKQHPSREAIAKNHARYGSRAAKLKPRRDAVKKEQVEFLKQFEISPKKDKNA